VFKEVLFLLTKGNVLQKFKMSKAEKLYQKAPVPIQNSMCSLHGWRIQKRRFGRPFKMALAAYEERASWSKTQILAYRKSEFERYLQWCSQHVPAVPTDCESIPIVGKLQVRGDIHAYSPPPQVVSSRIENTHTSGTTGGGFIFKTTESAVANQWAVWWRYRRLHGIDMTTLCGYFGGRSIVPLKCKAPPFWRTNRPGKQVMFSGYHLNQNTAKFYVQALNQFRPPWLHGYPSMLSLLAQYMKNASLTLDYPIKWITIGAENLLASQKQVIAEAFGVVPIQHYGLAEGVVNISQCKCGDLVVDEDYSFVEFIPNEKGAFRIIGTNWHNQATAFIRYDTDDHVQLDSTREECGCGRYGRIVSSIDGRKEDYIYLKDGTPVGRTDHIFKDMVDLVEAQIFQQALGEIVLRIVPGPNYTSSSERQLIESAKQRLGDGCIVNIEVVTEIVRTKTGKFRQVISAIPPESKSIAL